jgi:hypothetical protein
MQILNLNPNGEDVILYMAHILICQKYRVGVMSDDLV